MRRPAAVLDIETERWDRFVTGALYDGSELVVSRSEDDLADLLFAVEGDVWAHNGGRYDALWVAEMARRRGLKARVALSGSRITRLTVGKMVLRDSYALIPMALKKCAPMGGETCAKGETGLPCVCGRDCGGYCSIHVDMSDSDYDTLEEYLAQDCRVLWRVLEAVWQAAVDHGLQLRGTVGGTSWATAKHDLKLPDADWSMIPYMEARGAYYGGRCEVFQLAAPGWEATAPKSYCYDPSRVFSYDIHSAYPDALAHLPVPTGAGRLVTSAEARRAYLRGLPGHFRARVRVPEMDLPPLPFRFNGRLCWVFGTFSGMWTGLELRRAEEAGAVIEEFGPSIVWPRKSLVLVTYCLRIWDLRSSAGPKTAWGKWYKWIANSLTGKLAQRPDLEILAIGDAPRACDGGSRECDGKHHPPGKCCPHRCVGSCRRWNPLDWRGTIWSRNIWRIPECAHVHWAAHLTAATRRKLYDGLTKAGDSRIYCDTDGIKATGPVPLEVGDDLGDWGIEAPEGVQIAMKGVPTRTPESWDAWKRYKKIPLDRGVQSFKQAARGDRLFSRTMTHRSRQDEGVWVGSRRVEGARTVAVDVRELDEMRPTRERVTGSLWGVDLVPSEIARRLGVSETTARRWIAQGYLEEEIDDTP